LGTSSKLPKGSGGDYSPGPTKTSLGFTFAGSSQDSGKKFNGVDGFSKCGGSLKGTSSRKIIEHYTEAI